MEIEELQDKLKKMQADQRRDINLFRRSQKLGEIIFEDALGRNSIKSIAQRILDRKNDIDIIVSEIGKENLPQELEINELNNIEIEVEETGLVSLEKTNKFFYWLKNKFNNLKKNITKKNNKNSMKKVSIYDECKKIIEMINKPNKASLEKNNIIL